VSGGEWEAIRHMTIDQLVTATKLHGSSSGVVGWTTPEGWPFVVVVGVGSPGNERAVEWAREFHQKMAAAAGVRVAVNPEVTGGTATGNG
jgi:ABC-type sugar transport system substrate-binding protein